MIDTSKYEPTSNCGHEECNDGYDCEDRKMAQTLMWIYYKGEMVFYLICKNGFEWKEIWTYKGSEWLD